MNYIQKNKSLILFLLLLCLLTIPVLIPLFQKGFFLSDDGEWMIIRFSAFHQALRDGQFPVRFLSRLNFGYGYPVANFLYPGFMYLAEPFKIVGFGFVDSIKIIIGLSLSGSALFTFFWLSQRFSRLAAFTGSLVYLYTPYHLYDVYKRGSVGELLALAIVPFILWNIERKSFFWTSSGIGLLLLSHNTLAVLFLPVIFLYMLIQLYGQKEKAALLYRNIAIIVTGLGIAAFFWFPALLELSNTRFSSVTVSDISQYFAPADLIGAGSLVILGLSLFLITKKQKSSGESLILLLFTILTTVSIFYSSSFSRSIWPYLPSSFIQFPFRLLSYLIVSSSFLAAYGVMYFKGTARYFVVGVLIFLIGYSVLPYISPKEYFDKGEGFYATNEDTTTVKNEYMPLWVKKLPSTHVTDKAEVIKGEGKIENLSYNAKRITFSSFSDTDVIIRVNTIYYPGWKAYVDSNETNIDYNNDKGVMDIAIKQNQKHVTLVFSETPLRLLADVISLLSFAGLLGFSLLQRRIWKHT